MSREIFLIVGAGCDLVQHHVVDILDHPGMTAPLHIGQPPLTITLKREELMIPDLDIRKLREPKKRDWEQRGRKRRRK